MGTVIVVVLLLAVFFTIIFTSKWKPTIKGDKLPDGHIQPGKTAVWLIDQHDIRKCDGEFHSFEEGMKLLTKKMEESQIPGSKTKYIYFNYLVEDGQTLNAIEINCRNYSIRK